VDRDSHIYTNLQPDLWQRLPRLSLWLQQRRRCGDLPSVGRW